VTDAHVVTPVVDVPSSFLLFTALYLGLGVALVVLLLRLAGKGLPAAAAPGADATRPAARSSRAFRQQVRHSDDREADGQAPQHDQQHRAQ